MVRARHPTNQPGGKHMGTQELKTLDDALNQMILTGKALEAMERFYDQEVTMQENTDAPCVGLLANLEREKQFFAAVEQFHGARILAQAIGDGTTLTEWENDVQFKGAPRALVHQVSVRRWKSGKVVHERFYHK
jgi:hypothetical protein